VIILSSFWETNGTGAFYFHYLNAPGIAKSAYFKSEGGVLGLIQQTIYEKIPLPVRDFLSVLDVSFAHNKLPKPSRCGKIGALRKHSEGGFSTWRNPLLTQTRRDGIPERCWS